MINLAIIRTAFVPIDDQFYNTQEIGLAKSLLRYDYKISIISAADIKSPQIVEKNQGNLCLIYWPIRMKIRKNNCILKDMSDLFACNYFDIIQVQDSLSIGSSQILNFSKNFSSKLILHQGIYLFPNFIKRFLQICYENTLNFHLPQKIHACIAKTKSAADYLHMLRYKNIEIIPIGLDKEKLRNDSDYFSIRELLRIKGNDKILLYVGKLEPRRLPFFSLKIVSELHKQGIVCHLIIVGVGPMEDHLKNFIKNDPILSRYVHIVGKVKQNFLQLYYTQSDVLLHPSVYEIYGMVFLEAMYFNLPIVTSKTAGSEIIDKNHGCVVQNFVIKNWVDSIIKILQTTKSQPDRDNNSMENICWENLAYRYHRFYQKVINNEF